MTSSWRRYSLITFLTILVLAVFARPGFSDDVWPLRPIIISVHGGAQDDSASAGLDARVNLFNPLLDITFFGRFMQHDSSSGIGAVDTQSYGAGVAFSRTYINSGEVYIGAAMINELGENFGHAYLGGEAIVLDSDIITAMVAGAYGFKLGPERQITKNNSRFITAESVDWGKVGVTLVGSRGVRANLSYYLTDPGGEKISGLEGYVSYPVTANTSLGLNAGSDLTDKDGIDRNWRSFFSVSYAFGGQKGDGVNAALDSGSKIAFPRLIRTLNTAATSGTALSISPASADAFGCFSGTPTTFTASGGTGPYSWTASDYFGNITVINSTQAQWFDNGDIWCSTGGTVTITVTDSASGSATATVNVSAGGPF